MNKNKKANLRPSIGLLYQAIGGAALSVAALSASAASISTSNPDLAVRWDNTLKYNIGMRMEGRDSSLENSPSYHTSTLYKDKHDIVTNRLDVLSEFDVIYRRNHGFRMSAAAWNDFAYDDEVSFNPAFGSSPYPDDRFTSDVEHYYKRGAEILDAFVFTRVDVGDMPLNIRAGRHNIYWGESMFTFGNSIAYGQGPLDLRKASSTPGVEAKELFLPQAQLSGSMMISDSVSVAANYLFEWDAHRLSDGGTYLGATNVSLQGGQFVGFPYVGDESSGPYRTPKDRGSWGVNTQIRSETLGGNIGLYYRNFDDRMPSILLDAAAGVAYNAYAEDVKLYGVSYNRLVGPVSVGSELSYRENTLLATTGFGSSLARGNTMHALVNAVAFLGTTSFYDSASLQAELSYSRLVSVNSGSRATFNHEDYACTTTRDGGCATDDAIGLNLGFTPTWYQALPSVDITMPVSFAYGLSGNSPTPLGATEGSGSWSVGVQADIHARHTIGLAYNDYFGRWERENGQVVAAGGNAPLQDRGWLSLTLKTAF